MFLGRVCLVILLVYFFENILVCTATSSCPSGYYLASGSCVPAEVGYYALSGNKRSCIGSLYQDEPGQSFCKSCPEGKISNNDVAATNCTICGIGQQPKTNGGCANCPKGTSKSLESNTECSPCPRGHYQDEEGQGSCKICSQSNTYTDVQGSIACFTCPNGQFQYDDNGNFDALYLKESKWNCRSCPAGYLVNPQYTGTMTTGICVKCESDSATYCVGNEKLNLSMPVIGQTYISRIGGVYRDHILSNCILSCLENQYFSENCTTYGNAQCSWCSNSVTRFETYIFQSCSKYQNAVIKQCNFSAGDFKEGGICNPCMPGSVKKENEDKCMKCPGNTKWTQDSLKNTNCAPCEPNTFSVEGSTKCLPKMPSNEFGGQTLHLKRAIPWNPIFGVSNELNGIISVEGGKKFLALVNYPIGGTIYSVIDDRTYVAAGNPFSSQKSVKDGTGVNIGFGKLLCIEKYGKTNDVFLTIETLENSMKNWQIRELKYDSKSEIISSQILSFESIDPSYSLISLNFGEPSHLLFWKEGSFLISFKKLRVIFEASVLNHVRKHYKLTPWKGSGVPLPDVLSEDSLVNITSFYEPTKMAKFSPEHDILYILDKNVIWSSSVNNSSLSYVCGNAFRSTCSAVVPQNGACRELDLSCYTHLDMKMYGRNQIFVLGRGISHSGKDFNIFSIDINTKTWDQLSTPSVNTGFYSPYDLTGSLLLGFVSSPVEENVFLIYESKYSMNEQRSLGVSILMGSSGKHMCAAGTFYNESLEACVQTPLGYYSTEWNTGIIPCPVGWAGLNAGGTDLSACARCPVRLFDTSIPKGSINCKYAESSFCKDGTIWSSEAESCIQPCEPNKYYNGEDCVYCPLGTTVRETFMSLDPKDQCKLCDIGKYGSSPGVCSPCPENTTSSFTGSLVCSPVYTPSQCYFDGLHKTEQEIQACANNQTSFIDNQWWSVPGDLKTLSVTSGGTLFVGNGKHLWKMARNRGAPQWTMVGYLLSGGPPISLDQAYFIDSGSQIKGVKSILADYFPSTAFVLDDSSNSVQNPFSVMAVSDDERFVYFTENGASCIWKVEMYSEWIENSPSKNVPMMESPWKWVGDCNSENRASDFDGNRFVATFGKIRGMALMETDSLLSDILFVSTEDSEGCMNVRSVMITDGSVSTLIGHDRLQSPLILLNTCPVNEPPYVLATSRVSNVLYYSTRNMIRRLNIKRTEFGSIFLSETDQINPVVFQHENAFSNIESICTTENNIFFQVWNPLETSRNLWHMKNTLASPLRQLNNDKRKGLGTEQNIACLGRHLWFNQIQTINYHLRYNNITESSMHRLFYHWETQWYSANRTEISMHHINPHSDTKCAGGFARDFNSGCLQVGLGSYTGASDSLEKMQACPSGTRGIRSGMWSRKQCQVCQNGTSSSSSSFVCTRCPGNTCELKCDKGYYQIVDAFSGKTICTQCPAGHSSAENSIGLASCEPCSPGFYSNVNTSFQCVSCPPEYTSETRSSYCVRKCDVGKCSKDGETCEYMQKNYQAITSLKLGEKMSSVYAGNNNEVFMSNGNSIFYMLDNCPEYVDAKLSSLCKPVYRDLLPPMDSRCVQNFGRGILSMVMSPSYINEGLYDIYYLYVVSQSTYQVYRIPLYFLRNLLDVEKTKEILHASENTIGQCGLEKWTFCGLKGANPNFNGDGNCSSVSFSRLPDIAILRNGSGLVVSDFDNQRIRYIDIEKKTVRTLIGNSASVRCWRQGIIPTPSGATCKTFGHGGVNNPNGLTLDEHDILHISMQSLNGYGTIDMKKPVEFKYECLMNNVDQYKDERKKSYCSLEASSEYKSCFLYSPYDIVKYGSSLLVSVIDGITHIDASTKECTAVGGSFWKFGVNASGYVDGDVNTSKFNLPFRLSVSTSRKMLYIADRNNNALRRVYMESSCKCPSGFVFLPETRSCYNPLPNTARDQQCSFGSYFSLEDSKCKSCDEDAFRIINECILYQNIMRERNINRGYESGYSYQKVWGNPFPMINVKIADWFGVPFRQESESWNAFFKADSTVTYSLGSANGRAPYGSSFHTYTYKIGKCILQNNEMYDDGCWILEKRSDFKPKMILPGMWYPCHTSRDIAISSWRSEELLHTCPWNVGTFGDPDISSICAKASWECLKMAAIEGQGVGIGNSKVSPEKLENYVYRNSSNFYENHKIRAWSRFMIMGSSEADGEACGALASGPCFPVFKHVQEGEPESLSNFKLSGRRSNTDYQLRIFPVSWKNAKGVFSYVGWPSHYYCPDGYTWVAPNNSEIPNQNMFTKVGTDGIKAVVTCISCLPGTFSMLNLETKKIKGGPYQCKACNGGTFSSSVGATQCEVCPANFYGEKRTGSTTCISCPAGFFSLSGSWTNESCTPCAPGTERCNSCPAGFYQPLSAQLECFACAAGFFSPVQNSVKCNACAKGFYQDEAGREGCKPCELGKFSNRQASTTCTACEASTLVNCSLAINGVCGRGCGVNHYWDSDNKSCARCPSNGISRNSCGTGITVCLNQVTRGQYVRVERSPENGGDILDFCDSGKGPSADYRSCVLCSVGKYSVRGGAGCIDCPIGFFAANNGSSTCLACSPGQYSSVEGSGMCNNCPKGYAAINNMSSNCTPCKPGSYADQEGSAVCQLCKNSTFSTVPALEVPCDAIGNGDERGTCKNSDGYYSGMGATACSYCGVGEVVEEVCRGCGLGHYFNATEKKCRICPVGTVNDKNSSLTTVEGCQECPTPLEYAGENRIHCYRVQIGYMRNVAKNGEFPCPAGQYRGIQDVSCRDCSSGTYNDQIGMERCAKCPPGKYQPSEGAITPECIQCPIGTVAFTEGMSFCSTCADGYKPNTNRTLCETCPRNQYVSPVWKSCIPCSLNQVSPVGSFSSDHCKNCETPYYFDQSMQDCALCIAGKYKKGEGCEMCPAGKINANDGGTQASDCISCMVDKNRSHGYITNQERTQCVPCPRGQESSIENNTCIMCRPGYYSDDSNPCKPCEAGMFNNAFGSSACIKCDAGKYAMDTGVTHCIHCEAGKYNNETGQIQCKTCTFDLGFSSKAGQVQCTPRFQKCPTYGYYLRLNYEDPTKDNSCERCKYCASDELLVVYEKGQILNGSVSENQIFMEKYCPGNETKAGYGCLPNEPLAGLRLSIENPSNMAGSSATSVPGTGFVFSSSSYQYVTCNQIDMEAVGYQEDIYRKLVGYVAGSLSTECFVGCRYGIKEGGIQKYLEEEGGKGNSESPELNIFQTRMIKHSKEVCQVCPMETCSKGFYRPRSKDVDQCGPSCFLNNDEYRSACLRTNMDGCVLTCQPAPNNSVFSGGSNELDGRECPFECNIGFFKSSNMKGCISCEDDVVCGPGYIRLSPSECLPHYTMNDMCKSCAAIEGGRGKFFNTSLGKCVYTCFTGYYASNYGSECKRCNETYEPCQKGEYMDVQSCFVNGLKPICKPCNVSKENERSLMHFLTDGGSSAMQCKANCLIGYNTKYAANGTYIDISTTSTFSYEIQCELCNRDNRGISCNNNCFYGQYRDLKVQNFASVGACKDCKKDSQCDAGMRATKCTGNETSDSVCVKCPLSLLLDNVTKIQTKVFVPYNYQGIGAAAQCPTACKPNYFQANDGSCITCDEYVKSKGCASFSVANYEIGQPRPCDFKFSHWNASLGKRWWKPNYTPSFMALSLAVEDRMNPENNMYLRSGRCWACPPGTRTLENDPDLCTLNEGVGLGTRRVQETTLLSPRVNRIVSTANITRPFLSLFSLTSITLGPRRRLLQIVLNASNSSSGTDLVPVSGDVNESRATPQLCAFGFYKSNRREVKCDACPQGTTTATEGSTSIRQCICLPGHIRSVPNSTNFELMNSSNSFYDYSCVACGVDMYREFTSSEFACTKCPENETTFGLQDSSTCVCKLGFRRDWKTKKCIQCGKNEVCVPCIKSVDGKETERCPFAEAHVIPCFYGGISTLGSWNMFNCTCRDDEVQLTRNPQFEMDISIKSQRLAQENYYCYKKPLRAVYDAVKKQILCPWGWRSVFNNDTNPPVLVDCILCGLGSYSESLPNETSNVHAVCKKCPKGSYSDISWKVGNCSQCDSGFTTVEEGAFTKSSCDCPYPLTLSANGSQCEGCDSKINYYDRGSKRCVQCPPESMVASSTMNPLSITDCVCKAGYTMKTPNMKYEMNKDGCVPCSKGTYRGGGNLKCLPCPRGSSTSKSGATNVLECDICLEGYSKGNFWCVKDELV